MKHKSILSIAALCAIAAQALSSAAFSVSAASAFPASKEEMRSTSDGKYNPIVKSNRFLVTYSQVSNTAFKAYDSKRNIYIVTEGYNPEYKIADYYRVKHQQYFFENSLSGLDFTYSNVLGMSNLRDGTASFSSKDAYMKDTYAVGAMYLMQRIYDFYLNEFGWKGTDGKGSALAVTPYLFKGGSSFASPAGNYIAFLNHGKNSSEYTETALTAWDAAAHEYTHRVTISKVRWEDSSKYSEANALSEAYSDIMGEYFENKLTWKFGEDEYKSSGRCARDLTCSPASGKVYDQYRKETFYYNYNTYLNDQKQRPANNKIEEHQASTVISHAAYLMHKSGLPAYLGREIWFTSLDYLTQGADAATFIQCRTAVQKAAEAVMSKKSLSSSDKTKYMNYIKNAFNTVGVPDFSSKRGDVNGDGLINSTDVTKITLAARGYNEKDFSKKTADLNRDGRITTQDAEILSAAIRNHTTDSL